MHLYSFQKQLKINAINQFSDTYLKKEDLSFVVRIVDKNYELLTMNNQVE